MTALLTLGGGFLLAVVWMDLIFDVQALRGSRNEPLPEPALASIANYYRRVTTDARPMNLLIGLVMVATVLGTVAALFHGSAALGWRAAALALGALPISLAQRRVFPNAVRLGARSDSPEQQSALARTIARDHVACFAAMLGFVAIQLFAG
ncbi:MAG: hypothetical protein NTZ61_06855 [Proteobacteria bacterium]|nr:hypothetical protein [Pseudomonadota bacterium]